jgi:FAD/FMN-containing dehydrogenase
MSQEWSSWAGNVRCRPSRIERPADEAQARSVVRRAAAEGRCVRVVGSGHSSMPLVETDGVLVSLDALAGVHSARPEALEASVWAGTKLSALGAPLRERGMAFENLGDVDVQSLGGALGTGTHGTGRTLGNLSTRIARLRMITAAGAVLECSEESDPDLFRAAPVSLGALGLFTRVTLRLVPAYRLHERVWSARAEQCLEDVDRLIAENRHFEFFWYPKRDAMELKTLNPTQSDPDELPSVEGQRIGWSAEVIPSVREIKFHEMEYQLPAEAGLDCFREVRARLRERHPQVGWPVEYRTVAADDAWLSPAYGRDTVTISVHQDARHDYREPFADVEAIFRRYAGRPHWGKIHTCRSADLRELYPMWERFLEVRRRMDPEGRFLNAHLRELFGIG